MISNLGGKENIAAVTNCMTRVRVNVKNKEMVNFDSLSNLSGVIKVIDDETIQVVVGPGKSRKIKDIMSEILGDDIQQEEQWKENKEKIKSKNQSGLKQTLRKIGNIFVPLIPAIIAAGLLNGIAGYFENVLKAEGILDFPLWLTFMKTIGGALFSSFAIFVGINAAKEFGATPGLGGIIGGITISSSINQFSKAMGLFNSDVPLNSILTTGKGGIIGVILGVWILSIVEKKLRKIIPDMFDTIITPTISVSVAAFFTIFIIMPLAGFVSDGIIKVLETLIMTQGPLAIISGFVLAALFLPLLSVGLHHGLIPFYMIQLQQFGQISLFAILCMAGPAQIGGALAIYFKAKDNKKLREIISSALPVGVLGVGEPLLYGVTLPLGKPFITACIGGGFGGIVAAVTGVATTSFGPAGVTAIPLVVPGKILYYILGLTTSFICGFILTYYFGVPDDINEIKV
ncbi:PTS transporter subunit EIIC [Cetobacterium sp. 2A]|nr:PTS transporter subunit EIIC [Cetobacterium sp. 2A]